MGELASSALATATAVLALSLAEGPAAGEYVRSGLAWLLRNQNGDGGWGDTDRSLSNISTTALCWAALGGVPADLPGLHRAAARAETWLARAAGDLTPPSLVAAITRRYGKDRTFSVPILMALALGGRLGQGRAAWQRVPQLPFELAACPHAWFRWLRLPVVSYALPALIAIGQARHAQAPTASPLARALRALARERTLQALAEIQPPNGGFLEAVPLTSFVTMALVAAGQARHPVVERGLIFLRQSLRPDGSWPIDTNLATWVTTLAINALAADPAFPTLLRMADRRRVRDWLLAQQHRVVHPYTRAAPGGWAWTDLPGGVPDADDTPGALLALRNLDLIDHQVQRAAEAGCRWLLDLQNRDGGLPTFCPGWGALPFDRSGADLTAHALLAWTAWQDRLPPELQRRVQQASERALAYLARVQRADGAWVPLWFGNQLAPREENPTYGTARVLLALWKAGSPAHPPIGRVPPATLRALIRAGQRWLLTAQNEDGGWGGDRGVPSSLEETGLALQALAETVDLAPAEVRRALARGVAWLTERTEGGQHFEPAPIGFYFARLWYHEALYPVIYAVGGLARAHSVLATGRSGA